MQVTLDEDGEEMGVGEDRRFGTGRDGDHLMTPFQCDLCHFRNIRFREPIIMNDKDHRLLIFIRRANLDAFWSRETTTVKANMAAAQRMEARGQDRFGFESVTPPMGPFPLADTCGMKTAVLILDRSLDPGRNAEHVQYDTFRRWRSVTTNVTQAGVAGLGDRVMAYERDRMWVSGVPTHSFWFTRFMEGLHRRVGAIIKRDRAVTVDEIKGVENLLEGEWKLAKGIRSSQLRAAQLGVLFIVGFCTGLRGEEILQVELAGTVGSLKYLNNGQGHFRLILSGRTKNNQHDGAKFAVPCVEVTSGTGLMPGKWFKRLVTEIRATGRQRGRLLQRSLKQPKLAEFEADFFGVLERLQEQGGVPEDVQVREEFGLKRSMRRGSTAHARNMGLGRDVIEANNRWRTEANSRTGAPQLSMVDLYSELDAVLPMVLKYSGAL